MIHKSTTHAHDRQPVAYHADLAWLQYIVVCRAVYCTTAFSGTYSTGCRFTYLPYWLVILQYLLIYYKISYIYILLLLQVRELLPETFCV